jgi:hypothetical protein
MAREYIRGAGMIDDPEIFAILKVTGDEPRPGAPILRDPLSTRSLSYQRRIRGSRYFQREAAHRGLTVEDWYERAPSLAGARGHPERLKTFRPRTEYQCYIARRYTGLDDDAKRELSGRIKRSAGYKRAARNQSRQRSRS